MSFLTALSLSFNNLLTKKARTLLTAFAGSIGIIGIALIMSLSTGFQKYIDKIQEDTLSNYPLTIQAETADMAAAITRLQAAGACGYACVPSSDGDVLSVVQAPLAAGSVCVIGNEANGLTAETIDACAHRLTIPMAGRAESLNAAVAASLVMWEMSRREYVG